MIATSVHPFVRRAQRARLEPRRERRPGPRPSRAAPAPLKRTRDRDRPAPRPAAITAAGHRRTPHTGHAGLGRDARLAPVVPLAGGRGLDLADIRRPRRCAHAAAVASRGRPSMCRASAMIVVPASKALRVRVDLSKNSRKAV